MTARFAKDLATGASNHIKNVAIVGATGSIGTYIVKELLKTGKHSVSAITRADSKSAIPSGVSKKSVDYNNHASLVEGLKGQDALIITMATTAPKDTQQKLVAAAKDAGVQWIVPNEWGFSFNDPEDQFGKDIMLGPGIAKTRKYIRDCGLNFIGLTSGFWFQFSLGGGEERYGFDFKKQELTLFDEGEHKIVTSSWTQSGRAVAKVLSLPILPQDEQDKSLTVSKWRDDTIYIKSFDVSQKDLLASVLRVTGTKETDWKIAKVDVHKRFQEAADKMAKGDFSAFATKMYSRYFYGDEAREVSAKVQNDILGLPEEDLDTAVSEAVQMGRDGANANY